ncbi:ABC transporter permease [Propioniciclava coleopterorum]|uniref:ABC transporter permease n=1 Tax=Propioniciclava coleopterorum TaxID=2714937 RepID=UPI001980A0AF|nr:ABC transporter permease [Propioniciclava coleopterorum]
MVLLLALGVAASTVGRLDAGRAQVVAAVRAVVQLAAISLIITAAVSAWWWAVVFASAMFAVGVWTTTGRVGVRRSWPWVALAMACGVLPVMAVIFLTGAAPFTGVSIVALGGIVTGNMMTAHTLFGRRIFAELRAHRGVYEAGLSLGMSRTLSIGLVIDRLVGEALVPNLDQTRTVGLVTLPGAFIGVLLGGGSPLQAGAAQVLVLIGIMAGQALTVTVAAALVRRVRIIPRDLVAVLHR